jgi:hypothetical protein
MPALPLWLCLWAFTFFEDGPWQRAGAEIDRLSDSVVRGTEEEQLGAIHDLTAINRDIRADSRGLLEAFFDSRNTVKVRVAALTAGVEILGIPTQEIDRLIDLARNSPETSIRDASFHVVARAAQEARSESALEYLREVLERRAEDPARRADAASSLVNAKLVDPRHRLPIRVLIRILRDSREPLELRLATADVLASVPVVLKRKSERIGIAMLNLARDRSQPAQLRSKSLDGIFGVTNFAILHSATLPTLKAHAVAWLRTAQSDPREDRDIRESAEPLLKLLEHVPPLTTDN